MPHAALLLALPVAIGGFLRADLELMGTGIALALIAALSLRRAS